MVSQMMFLLVGIAAGRAPYQPVHHDAPLASRVTLRISTDRSSYYVGEPLLLRSVLRNVGDTPLRGYFNLRPSSGFAEVQFRRVGSTYERFTYEKNNMTEEAIPVDKILAPGKELTNETPLVVNPSTQRFVLGRAGDYEFRVLYRDVEGERNSELTSNVVLVRVADPPAPEALKGYTPEIGLLIQWDPGDLQTLPAGVGDRAQQLLDTNPSTQYADHIRRVLFRSLELRVNRNQATKEEVERYKKLLAAKQQPEQ